MRSSISIGVCGFIVFMSSSAYTAKPYGSSLCAQEGYQCERVYRRDTWKKRFPNLRERRIVMALNRTNMRITHRREIVVPDDLSSLTMLDVAPFPLYMQVNNEKTIVVNLQELAFGAYNKKGKLVHWGAISGGKDYCPDTGKACKTVTGSFKVYSKRGKHCISNTFPIETAGGAPMPYCMFFHGGYALHASTTVPGYHASHGCVRMSYHDARWLSKYFVETGKNATRVIVSES